jgi:phosphoribosyl-AMP cyclohydrolase
VIAQEQGSKRRADVRLDEPRGAGRDRAKRGQAVYWSRSRRRLWHKGEESGHVQQVHEIRLDCDADVMLLSVTQLGHEPGIACHTGRHSCFFQRLEEWSVADRGPGAEGPRKHLQVTSDDTLARLADVIESRRGGDPDKSYVARLFPRAPTPS